MMECEAFQTFFPFLNFQALEMFPVFPVFPVSLGKERGKFGKRLLNKNGLYTEVTRHIVCHAWVDALPFSC